MNAIYESIVPPVDDIRCNQEPDGGFTLAHGPTTISFSSLEMAQIERGLVSTDDVRACIIGILGFAETLEQTLGADRQRSQYRQSQQISLN